MVRLRIKSVAVVLVACSMAVVLLACGSEQSSSSSQTAQSTSAVQTTDSSQDKTIAAQSESSDAHLNSSEDSSSSSSEASSEESHSSGSALIDKAEELYDKASDTIETAIENRANATPTHAAIGEELEATKNLAVSVVSVEPGPYDYADKTPTVKVVVAMRNTSDKTVHVKASNWDADTTDGRRVDHKYYVKDENGDRSTKSFLPTTISPGATFQGELYFDGEGLVSVIYEPHWLVSSQNEYLYFDL
ncbi:MAG: DUF4352 domain-containing protein [Atopobiaceae bacterium]|nr:DUF4352 domain-containing protein [Atopobiaceae bacterium]